MSTLELVDRSCVSAVARNKTSSSFRPLSTIRTGALCNSYNNQFNSLIESPVYVIVKEQAIVNLPAILMVVHDVLMASCERHSHGQYLLEEDQTYHPDDDSMKRRYRRIGGKEIYILVTQKKSAFCDLFFLLNFISGAKLHPDARTWQSNL